MSDEQQPWWEKDPKMALAMRRRITLAKLQKDSLAALKASSPHARRLVVIRCGERACGRTLASVTATQMGLLYHARLPWNPSSFPRSGEEHRLVVTLANMSAPEVFGATLQSLVHGLEEDYHEERATQIVVELLDHPCPVAIREPLAVRCSNHPVGYDVDRGALTTAIQIGARTGKPTKMLIPEQPSPVEVWGESSS